MKRARALIPLSRDHHEALVLARRALEPHRPGAAPHELLPVVRQRWHEHLEPHFCKEEEVLVPALVAANAAAAAKELCSQHERLRAPFAPLDEGDAAALPAWGEALRDHVQWEERQLFPMAEKILELTRLERQLESA